MSRTADQARTILTDATVLATYIDAALNALHDSRGGYPTQTPGSAPITAHSGQGEDADIKLTAPEAGAANSDPATRDLQRIIEHIAKAHHHTARAATLAARWGNPALDDSAIARRLQDIDRSIWCHNCHKHGHANPRQEGRTECRDCADFRRVHGVNRTGTIIDRKTRGITLRPDFIAAELVREYGPGWRKQMPKPAKPRKKSAA